jgi:hypothetical protein
MSSIGRVSQRRDRLHKLFLIQPNGTEEKATKSVATWHPAALNAGRVRVDGVTVRHCHAVEVLDVAASHLWQTGGCNQPTDNYTHNQNPETKDSMWDAPRTPAALLELRGGFKSRPSRLRARQYEPVVTTPLPEPPKRLTTATTAAWREIQSRGFWLTSADRFLVEIAAALMARYRLDELKSGDVSLLIGLLGKIGFSPKERGALNLPTRSA